MCKSQENLKVVHRTLKLDFYATLCIIQKKTKLITFYLNYYLLKKKKTIRVFILNSFRY